MKGHSKITVNLYFTNDQEVQRLNKKWLGRDYSTDVLSFKIDQQISSSKSYLGDVVVSLPQAKRNAKKLGHSLEDELVELATHGLRHLLGIHHPGDE
ncbi:MAG: rRNA maturation RNase YbeY [bacterium]|nr:rRNA maturation RNase YbeY [bacterium]